MSSENIKIAILAMLAWRRMEKAKFIKRANYIGNNKDPWGTSDGGKK